MQRTGWGSMFGKNNESSSSSERTKRLKTKHIFRNRDTLTDSGTLFYDSKNLQRATSFEEFYNLYEGFKQCKIENKQNVDNSGCFHTWLDNEAQELKQHSMEDWFVSKIDYFSVPSLDIPKLEGKEWPYDKNSLFQKTIPEKYTFFDEENPHRIFPYVKDFKEGFSKSRY